MVCLQLCIGAGACFAEMKHASAACSPWDSTGYVLLHPYFTGKNWASSYAIADIVVPDTLCSQKIRPVNFDIGKNIDSTMAVFSTADGSFFIMPSRFSSYIGSCLDGEISFAPPLKVIQPGIAFSATTPFYLIKDSVYNFDSILVVVASSNQFLLALTIQTGALSISRIDTLRMATAGSAARISGEFSASANRDTSIWVSGANGMIKSFSYRRTGWGSEVNRNIAGSTDTITCVSGLYAGANTGKIYKKNALQAFVLDNSASTQGITALYPQGAIGKNGNFVELAGNAWRPDTLGTGNYRYANFIKRPGGFGVELLDSKWQYSVFTYRDTSSKIWMTLPGDRYTYANGSLYKYPLSGSVSDTGLTVYFSDPDSNFKDVNFVLKHGNSMASLKTNGTDTIRALSDSESCGVGAVRLTTGIVNFKLSGASIVVSAQTEKGAINVNCGACYWKKYNYTATRSWQRLDTLIITAGKDYLKISGYHAGSDEHYPRWSKATNRDGFFI